jgi:hypothetical protein
MDIYLFVWQQVDVCVKITMLLDNYVWIFVRGIERC